MTEESKPVQNIMPERFNSISIPRVFANNQMATMCDCLIGNNVFFICTACAMEKLSGRGD